MDILSAMTLLIDWINWHLPNDGMVCALNPSNWLLSTYSMNFDRKKRPWQKKKFESDFDRRKYIAGCNSILSGVTHYMAPSVVIVWNFLKKEFDLEKFVGKSRKAHKRARSGTNPRRIPVCLFKLFKRRWIFHHLNVHTKY